MTSYDSLTSETMNLSQMQEELQQLRAENDALNKRVTLGGATGEAMDESKAKVMLVRANRDVVGGCCRSWVARRVPQLLYFCTDGAVTI